MSKKYTYQEVREYIESFGYKLLSTEYLNSHTRLLIKCPNPNHKPYEVKFYSFKNGSRCPKCKSDKQSELYSFTYDYVKEYIENLGYKLLSEEYQNNKTKLLIKCDKGHIYETTFDNLKRGRKCRECSGSKKHSYEEVKDYLLSFGYELLSNEYKDNKTKLKMKCPNGHIIDLKFNHFKSGVRCSKCKHSKGEEKIEQILNMYDIEYAREYKFKDCKLKKCLPFDFYLPKYNICIEYDGEQHYKIARNFNMDLLDLMNIRYRDNYKTLFCKENNVKLIRISYLNFKNIETIIINELNLK